MSEWKFEQLTVWRKGMALAVEICRLTRGFPAEDRFGLGDQMRRAAMSVPANVAEGQMRGSDREYRRYVNIALSSAGELLTHVLLCRELGLIDPSASARLRGAVDEIGRMLRGLRRAISP